MFARDNFRAVFQLLDNYSFVFHPLADYSIEVWGLCFADVTSFF